MKKVFLNLLKAVQCWGLFLFVAAAALAEPAPSPVDHSAGDNWWGYGRTYGQQHYSPLNSLNAGNLSSLGLAWFMDLPLGNTVTEPIAVDGIIYLATGLSIVRAVEATTGRELWQYDPQVGAVGGLNLRNGWGVRGLAWWQGKLYVGSQDGRLMALDAATGKLLWSRQTLEAGVVGHVNGAPRVFNGRVLIGYGGVGPARGYVTAYDADNGNQLWRFWTVPGNPAEGFENDTMAMAAKTWSGEWWQSGGGATVWNSMAYDPDSDTVFIGTGSGNPWNHRIRSQGKGDNLFVSSIVALDGATGGYRWHYQTTPGDTWDYDATMDIELADLVIDGKPRKVLMQAPKNGFFYVIDRTNGQLISAAPHADVTWATGVDVHTGRPVEAPGARFSKDKMVRLKPGTMGAHSWMAMAYSPRSELVYLPAIDIEMDYGDIDRDWRPTLDGTVDGGLALAAGPYAGLKAPTGKLVAWSPAKQRAVWQVDYPTYLNGGVLATGGDLVFQGSVDGLLRAFDAQSGKQVWAYDAKAPILAPPITYSVNGTQYLSVLTGSGMGIPMFAAMMVGSGVDSLGLDPRSQARRLLTFAIGGSATLPPRSEPLPPPDDPTFTTDQAREAAGMTDFFSHCVTCHGALAVGVGHAPDLRRSALILDPTMFSQIVKGGMLESRGMPKFGEFDAAKLEDIRHYLRAQAAQLRAGNAVPVALPQPGSTGM